MALKAILIILVLAVVGGGRAASERAMADVAAAILTVQSMQLAFQIIQNGTPTAWRYPASTNLDNGGSYDYIIVGGGSSGCCLANRLTANPNITVLLIEAGGFPPVESEMPGLFSLLVRSPYDYNFTSIIDGVSAKNLRDQSIGMTQGKMLGGSSGLNHMMHTHGDSSDYDNWAKLLDDPSWNYENMQRYLKKMEKLTDAELLDSEYASVHGTDGPIMIERDQMPVDENYMNAFAELGHNIVKDVTSATSALGFAKSLFEYVHEKRQSSALGYIAPIKDRPNLSVALFTTATKILIKNKKAVGVKVSTSTGKTKKLYANREVIVSAGAINTPKLLMLSGIGPKEHLESHGIKVVADLPVGQDLQDHTATAIMYQMEESTESVSSYPHGFPAPSFNGYVALDPAQSYPDYMSINLLVPPNSSDLLQLCVNDFKFTEDICQKFYDATKGRKSMFSIIGLAMPESRGQVLLESSDPSAAPRIYSGVFNDTDDEVLVGKVFKDFNRVVDTSYFKKVNASMVDVGVCSDKTTEDEFWQCYGVDMSATMWHYAGTCSMGKVLDNKLRVKGVESLRVVDASAMPTLIRAKLYAGVMALAEHGADIIIESQN